MSRLRFGADGLYAIDSRALRAAFDPRAFGFFFEPPPPPKNETRNGVVLVTVRGALKHHDDVPGVDSYDAIRGRVAQALELKPKGVLLVIDSPGGDCSGCLESARELRAMAAAASVPLYAWVEGHATSAAYALATSAQLIGVAPSAIVGSIGVIDALYDVTKADERMGVHVELITSGARKSDTNPHSGLTPEARIAAQTRVDDLALLFFQLVAEMRPVARVESLKQLEAGMYVGAKAVAFNLADQVMTLGQMLAAIGEPKSPAARAASANEDHMDETEKQARASLQAIIDGEGDEKSKAKARKALAAMDDGDGADAAEGGDEGDEKDEPAAAEVPDKDEDKDPPAARASARARAAAAPGARASADPTVVELATTVSAQDARLSEVETELEDERKAKLFSGRPDLGKSLVEVLKKKPFAEAKAIVDSIEPKKPVLAATSGTVSATRGATQGEPAAAPEPHELDVRMGLARKQQAVVHKGAEMKLGVLRPDEAREIVARREREAKERGAKESAARR